MYRWNKATFCDEVVEIVFVSGSVRLWRPVTDQEVQLFEVIAGNDLDNRCPEWSIPRSIEALECGSEIDALVHRQLHFTH